MILYKPKKREINKSAIQVRQLGEIYIKYNLNDIKKETNVKEFYEQYTENDRKRIS